MTIEHHEDWYNTRISVHDFPWNESFSKDPEGRESVFYSRKAETMRRNLGKNCSFPDEVKLLKTEGCSEVQALISAQLLSNCD
jgi:hypothetical protein